jgi:two-component system, LytTR family, sensor kinase
MASLDLQTRKGTPLYKRADLWALYVLIWTFISVMFAVQAYIGAVTYPGQKAVSLHAKTTVSQAGDSTVDVKHVHIPLRFRDHLRWSMEVWYTRAILSPLALWVALNFRVRRGTRLLILCGHLLASISLDIIDLLVIAELSHAFGPDHLAFPIELTRAVSAYIVWNFLIYWVLVGVVHAWYYYSDSQQQALQRARLNEELAQMRLTVLKSQLHPHFLFNSLHSIGALVHEDPNLAEDLLLRVGHLLRTFLQDTHIHEVSLRKEIAILDSQFGIECIRFGDRLTTRTEIEDGTLDCAVPHLIFQPLVENAIRHGIGKHPGTDEVVIRVKKMDHSLQLEVMNFSSVLVCSENEALCKGVGLSNVQARLRELYDDRYSLRLTSLQPRGVSVCINLPLRTMTDGAESMPGFLL